MTLFKFVQATLLSSGITLALLGTPAMASECDEYDHDGVVNLETPPQNFLSDIKKNDASIGPTRDQDEIGYCYAYAAADLLEHWMKKHGQMPATENVSAMALALRHDSNNWNPYDPLHSPVARIQEASALNQFSSMGANLASLMSSRLIKTSTILGFIAEDLKAMTTNREGVVKQGGFSNTALNGNLPTLGFLDGVLYESDVSSRDNSLKEVTRNHSVSLQSRANQPDDFAEGLLYLGEFFYAGAPNSCAAEVADAIFPSAQIRNLQDLKRIAREASDKRIGPFDQLLATARKNRAHTFTPKSPPPRFEVKTEEVQDIQLHRRHIKTFGVYPLPDDYNQRVINSIEEGLDQGEVVSFAYPAELLLGNSLSQDGYHAKEGRCKDQCANHESMITGKLKVCGKEYFVLRNSWGQSACSTTRERFINSGKTQELQELDVAIQRTQHTASEDERAEKLKERTYSELRKRRARLAEVPYFCDTQGNYIVRKDYLRRGVYTATRIQSPSSP